MDQAGFLLRFQSSLLLPTPSHQQDPLVHSPRGNPLLQGISSGISLWPIPKEMGGEAFWRASGKGSPSGRKEPQKDFFSTLQISCLMLLLLVSHYVASDSLWSHGLQHTRLLCYPLFHRVCLNSCPLSQWCYLTISSSLVWWVIGICILLPVWMMKPTLKMSQQIGGKPGSWWAAESSSCEASYHGNSCFKIQWFSHG